MVCCVFVAQRSAEDQPNEQEEGSWQSGTLHAAMSSVDFYLTFYRFTVRAHLSLSYRKNLSWLNSCGAPHLLASHMTSELHASLCLRRCSVSTQLSVLPMLNLAQLYSILLPWATGHILHNAALYSLCTRYTLMDNSCRIFKITCWRGSRWRQQNTRPGFVEESVQLVALKNDDQDVNIKKRSARIPLPGLHNPQNLSF